MTHHCCIVSATINGLFGKPYVPVAYVEFTGTDLAVTIIRCDESRIWSHLHKVCLLT